ncbi:MAG: alanine racemase [Hyphomicrobiaceae bacterium]
MDLPAAIDAAGAPVLTVDRQALAENWRTLAARAAPAECAAVVKANAYGCGIEIAVPALAAAGCRTFFVAHLSEARRVRAVAPSAILYVLHGLPPGAAPLFLAIAARPVLGSRPEIEEWARHGAGQPAALHVDTGMNRLGLRVDHALALAADGAMTGSNIALLISHFISSEVAGDPLNGRQIAAFERVRAAFPGVPASLANSSGILLPGLPASQLVRPGYALYGGNPVPGGPNPMRPVVCLEAPVLQVRDVPAGETVGYNAAWTAAGPRRIAVVSAGYADGIDRRATASDAGAGGHVLVGGRLCPVAGRISMDLMTIDITGLPDGNVRRGGRVTLIGGELTVDRVAAQIGTIGYEVLTGLAARVHRTGVDG